MRESFLAAVAVLLAFPPLARAKQPDPPCPTPTVSQGSLCVLNSDVDLSAVGTMEVASNTHLNCLGHRIYTSAPGTDVDHRSNPEIAIHLAGAFGVKIQNCVFDGFDFPILAHDIKVPADAMSDPTALDRLADSIDGNKIHGVFTSVELVNVDNMRITGNTITNTWGNGAGILVLRNSRINQIVNNTITHASSALVSLAFLPGPTSTENPASTDIGTNIFITHGTTLPNLLNMIFGGTLYQYPNAIPEFGPDGTVTNGGAFIADNVIEGNTLTGCGVVNCIANSNAQRTLIDGNQLSNIGSGAGITFGNSTLSGPFPGKCSPNQDRWCLTDDDCNIPIVGSVSQGTCSGVATKTVLSISNGGVITNNTITGPFAEGMELATPNILIQGNTITGPITPGTEFDDGDGEGVGIQLNKRASPTAVVTHNVVSNVPAPVRFLNGNPTGAQISLNDFTGYNYEIFVYVGYHVPIEFSVGLQGNYWGLPCSPGGGGGFDSNNVLALDTGLISSDGTVNLTGSVNLFAHDSHPYGVPVAATDPSQLPTTLAGGYCSASQ
jgi:hypothetical protein